MPKPKHTTPRHAPRFRPGRRHFGFTAIEISAVATIIAILSLILIPIVRSRVAEAKIVAAKDDLVGIEKAEQMAFGYTGHYFRLMDLNLPEADQTIPKNDTRREQENRKLPAGYWDRPVLANELNNLYETWKGPFMVFHRYETLATLTGIDNGGVAGTHAGFFDSYPRTEGTGGPILIFEKGQTPLDDQEDWRGTGALTRRQYPIDPWGTPYLFEGSETDYKTAVAYSLGPDLMPGSPSAGIGTNAVADYFRKGEILGQGDDISREF